MANRDNHYEAAFEEYLRGRGVPYVAVDEAKRSVLSDGGSIKSLDLRTRWTIPPADGQRSLRPLACSLFAASLAHARSGPRP